MDNRGANAARHVPLVGWRKQSTNAHEKCDHSHNNDLGNWELGSGLIGIA
jgi:hypothetical protein